MQMGASPTVVQYALTPDQKEEAMQEKVVFLSVWFIGDVYEITSLGFALRHQAHKIAQSILLPTELAKRL